MLIYDIHKYLKNENMLIQAIGGSLDTDWWWFLTKRNWREALEKQRQFDQSTLERGGQ